MPKELEMLIGLQRELESPPEKLPAIMLGYAIAIMTQALQIEEYRSECARLRKIVEENRKAELPFSDLARAAEKMLKARSPAQKDAARTELSSALALASVHIDWIPF